MAKVQTFGDKLKKKKIDEKPVVKVIKGFSSNGGIRFVEQFVKIDDMSQIDKIDITK